MTRKFINRGTAAALTTAVVLGAAGPAAARYDLEATGPAFDPGQVSHYQKANVLPPFVPKHMKAFPENAAPVTTATPRAVVNHPATGGSSDLAYVIVGGVVVAIGGLSGAFAVGRKRGIRTAAQPRSTIAA